MKKQTIISVILLVMVFLYDDIVFADSLSAEQVNKLISAAWKERPHSIDITLYQKVILPPESAEQLRQKVEDTFNKMEGPKENLSGYALEQRNRDIELNVKRILSDRQSASLSRRRIRIDGYRQRIDEVFAHSKTILFEDTPYKSILPEVKLEPNTPWDMTFVNSGNKLKGDFTSFVYYYKNNTAQINHQKEKMWDKSEIIDLVSFPSIASGILQMALGINIGAGSSQVFVPDVNKIADLTNSGKIGLLKIGITPDLNTPDINDRIEIRDLNNTVIATLVCDRNDYSKVYYAEIRIPATGKPIYVRECNNFDSQGFPRKISVTHYGVDGNFIDKKICEIEDANFNAVIPDNVFAFNPPDDFEIVETDVNGITKVVREKGGIDGAMRQLFKAQKEMDIEALKNLLGHKIWQIRLRSLQVLESVLLEKNPKELKESATILNNDENPEVRKKAKEIIERIERLDSVKKQLLSEKQ